MDSWKLESSPGKQTALAAGLVLIGLVLALTFRNFGAAGAQNSLAGFLLGILLLLIGICAFLLNGTQTTVIDPRARRISIADTNRFRTRTRTIEFSDIIDTRVGYFGKARSFVTFYYVVLTLRSGDAVSLFPLGRFYDGSRDRAVMESRRLRIQEFLKN